MAAAPEQVTMTVPEGTPADTTEIGFTYYDENGQNPVGVQVPVSGGSVQIDPAHQEAAESFGFTAAAGRAGKAKDAPKAAAKDAEKAPEKDAATAEGAPEKDDPNA